jgi:ABC-2 type transport system ATP-binding protein
VVEFRLLGPVEAHWRGGRVDLGPRKSRFVLAVLALEVNRPVAVDRLVDLTWPEEQPRTARHAVRVFASQLRTTLATVPDGAAGIERHGSGYMLRCDPQRIDVHRFRAALGEARGQTDDHRTVALLDAALGLWIGRPLDGCAPPEVRDALCGGLEEARLSALEDRLDARLRLGQHRLVLDELTNLVGRYPTRDRLVGQLMLALYRDGRAGDALAVYRAARDRWATQLGLDPSPQLRRLETAILRADPAIAAPPSGGTPVAPVPAADSAVARNLRVVLVDDHPMFRAGMRAALEADPEITVIAEAGDVASAMRVMAQATPDVVVMDLHLPDGSGVEATRLLCAAHPGLPILIMTMSGTDDDIVDALRAGARGYILKSAGREEVLNAIRGVVQGAGVFSADIAARLAALVGPAPGTRLDRTVNRL